jgi:hypothetical protein
MDRMADQDVGPAPALSELAFHILLALGDRPSHGYGIGTYFALTKQGRRVAAQEARRLDSLVRAARQRKLDPQAAK